MNVVTKQNTTDACRAFCLEALTQLHGEPDAGAVRWLNAADDEQLYERATQLRAQLALQDAIRPTQGPTSVTDAATLVAVSPTVSVRLRRFNEGDLSFVVNSWLKSYADSQEMTGLANDVYYAGMTARVGRIAERAQVLIACNPAAPSQIHGWMCYEPATDGSSLVVHYVYVRHDLRRMGVAKALFEAAGGDRGRITLVSHYNHRVKKLSNSYDIVWEKSLVK